MIKYLTIKEEESSFKGEEKRIYKPKSEKLPFFADWPIKDVSKLFAYDSNPGLSLLYLEPLFCGHVIIDEWDQ